MRLRIRCSTPGVNIVAPDTVVLPGRRANSGLRRPITIGGYDYAVPSKKTGGNTTDRRFRLGMETFDGGAVSPVASTRPPSFTRVGMNRVGIAEQALLLAAGILRSYHTSAADRGGAHLGMVRVDGRGRDGCPMGGHRVGRATRGTASDPVSCEGAKKPDEVGSAAGSGVHRLRAASLEKQHTAEPPPKRLGLERRRRLGPLACVVGVQEGGSLRMEGRQDATTPR